MRRFKTPIVIVITLIVLFASFFIFPLIGFAIGMGDVFEWERREINSLTMSGVFILVWIIVLVIAAKLKSKFVFGVYLFYWLIVVGTCTFTILAVLFNVDVLFILLDYFVYFFVIPIYGVTSLLLIVGIASPQADLTVFCLFVAIIIFMSGVFVKRKFLHNSHSTNEKEDTIA